MYYAADDDWGVNVDSSWNVMAHGDAREGKWMGNWRMEWVASTLHTTTEHGVSSITTADAHTSAASSRLNWRPRRFKWTRPFSPKDEIWFLRVCHHISNAVYICMVAEIKSARCANWSPEFTEFPRRTEGLKRNYVFVNCSWVDNRRQ